MGQQALEHLRLVGEFLVPALGSLFTLVYSPLDQLHVGHDELQVDYIYVARRVGAALDVDDILVVKAAHHVDDGVRAAYVLQEFVAQALAVAGALDKPGYVHELYDGRGVLLGAVQVAQEVQPLIGHSHHADVGLDGAERVVGALRARVGDGVEQGALAHVGQAHNS